MSSGFSGGSEFLVDRPVPYRRRGHGYRHPYRHRRPGHRGLRALRTTARRGDTAHRGGPRRYRNGGHSAGSVVQHHGHGRGFGILLALAVVITGVLLWIRERRAVQGDAGPAQLSSATTAAVGLVVATAAGLFGLGGPMLSVPLLVICGLPVLPALAAAQAQSVVIAGTGTAAVVSVFGAEALR